MIAIGNQRILIVCAAHRGRRFRFPLFSTGGTHILFHPLSFCGKGVARMTISELYEFCLVLTGLANLVVQIIEISKKK